MFLVKISAPGPARFARSAQFAKRRAGLDDWILIFTIRCQASGMGRLRNEPGGTGRCGEADVGKTWSGCSVLRGDHDPDRDVLGILGRLEGRLAAEVVEVGGRLDGPRERAQPLDAVLARGQVERQLGAGP